MYISELRVRHFRNFLKARFIFRKGVNTLIGENGSGKTNALYALRLLLDDSLSRNATRLRENDFCRALGPWRGHWIILSLDFAELDPSEGCQLLKHENGHMDGTDTGTYTLYFRPKLEVRKCLHGMSTDGSLPAAFQQYLAALTVDDYEPCLTGRATADFLQDDAYTHHVGDFGTFVFPDPDDDDLDKLGTRVAPIHPEITCTFAPALRDVISDLRGYRSNPLLGLLRGTESQIRIEDAERITSAVGKLNSDISSLPEIRAIASGVQQSLHSTVGHTYSPEVIVESALPDQLDKLLQRLTLMVGDHATTYRGDLSEQGLGGANLIYLAMKLLEYEIKLSSDRVAHFLLIEEPEAHIHTHIQKVLFEHQSTRRTQVIVSTHSTHISSAASIRSVNVLACGPGFADVFQPATDLDEDAAARVERYLDAVRSTLLFAKGVILVEGEAELVMIPAMVRSVLGVSLDELAISVIAMDSAFFEHVAILFHPVRIRRRCAIVTDLDTALIPLPAEGEEADEAQRHAMASQETGAARAASLGDFTQDNPWVRAFLAEHTFEVDFVTAGNTRAAVDSVDALYVRQADRERSKAALRANDPVECGLEILRLAKKVGKGWFALLLSEHLADDAVIPEYILRAIAFAAEGLRPEVFKRMGQYRLSCPSFDPAVKDLFPEAEDLERMPPWEYLELFTDTAPEDPLSSLLVFIREYEEC